MIKPLITELVNGAIPIEQALTKAKLIASKIKDDDFKKWINSELFGYEDNNVTIPNYRIINCKTILNFTERNKKTKSIPFDTSEMDDEEKKLLCKTKITRSVSDISDFFNTHKSNFILLPETFDSSEEAKELLSEMQFADEEGMLTFNREVHGQDFKKIVDITKQRLLDTLLELNETFPDLENDFQMTTEKHTKVRDIIQTFIYGNNNLNQTNMEHNEFKGNAVVVRDNASASDFTQNQINYELPDNYDYNALSADLKTLKEHLKSIKNDDDDEQVDSFSNVSKAEKSAVNGDSNNVTKFLKNAGKWALDAATKIGTTIAADVIKKSMGQ